jgi:hypothetical protein
MHHLPGLDAYLTPPDPIEVELVDAECGECGTVQDVSTYSNSDEADWECCKCGSMNTAYYDEDPEAGRGWS